ncbi:uncharacterized protein LOC105775642 [Gossypium raimondii]|uniref:uncharacterized protein LOC105775642 n=1 Tax=Gossypium raimondii TaxID=29730 RepID=UPI00227BFF8B|nr:uncharacterized protein LOC105775642 [Gossypium raimondii]
MEMMKLKPSFARKLNQQYLSPLHLAVRKEHRRMVLRFLEIDKNLIRVKGKNGNTPLHIISEVGNRNGLLDRFLEICPQSIREVTIENRNALHIAVENDRLDVLQAGWMALDIAERYGNKDSITVLRGCFIPGVSNFNCKLEKQIVKYVTKASSPIFHGMVNISGEDRNALLVILGLLLTVTYQASLSPPPGGVWQVDNTSKSKGSDDSTIIGRSVMDQSSFLHFYIPIYIVFLVTFFLILALLKPFPHGFRTALQLLLAFLAMCLNHDVVS